MNRYPVTLDTTLEHCPWIILNFRCHYCHRAAERRLVHLAINYGPNETIRGLVRRFMAGCPYDPHNPSWKPRKYGHHCGAYCPDARSTRPPDLPPSLSGLTLIEGGAKDMRPAKPVPSERRRRVGEDY